MRPRDSELQPQYRLADARGSELSHDREGVPSNKSTESSHVRNFTASLPAPASNANGFAAFDRISAVNRDATARRALNL